MSARGREGRGGAPELGTPFRFCHSRASRTAKLRLPSPALAARAAAFAALAATSRAALSGPQGMERAVLASQALGVWSCPSTRHIGCSNTCRRHHAGGPTAAAEAQGLQSVVADSQGWWEASGKRRRCVAVVVSRSNQSRPMGPDWLPPPSVSRGSVWTLC